VRQGSFHTVVIGGFVPLTGPFQLKWWLWFLYRPKMVLLVFEAFGYYVGHMPHKFRNQYLIFTHDLLVLVDRKTSFLVDYMEKSIQINQKKAPIKTSQRKKTLERSTYHGNLRVPLQYQSSEGYFLHLFGSIGGGLGCL